MCLLRSPLPDDDGPGDRPLLSLPVVPAEDRAAFALNALIDAERVEVLVRAADRRGCDLIAVGTHGRTGLGRLLIDSVAEKVVRHARCPVVAVRPVKAPRRSRATGATAPPRSRRATRRR